jgi:hypothetical protein
VSDLSWQNKQEAIDLIRERDGANCFICGGPFGKKEKVTIDHWIPLSKGGTWKLSNLRIAHKSCNLWKGDRVPLPDGTIPEKPTVQRKKKSSKSDRPKICNVCMSGRVLRNGQVCPSCSSGPQPIDFPGWAKRNTRECDHGRYHCFACILGFVKRKQDGIR